MILRACFADPELPAIMVAFSAEAFAKAAESTRPIRTGLASILLWNISDAKPFLHVIDGLDLETQRGLYQAMAEAYARYSNRRR